MTVRKDSDKNYKNRESDFIELIWALQERLPAVMQRKFAVKSSLASVVSHFLENNRIEGVKFRDLCLALAKLRYKNLGHRMDLHLRGEVGTKIQTS